jgi:biotin carboxylase
MKPRIAVNYGLGSASPTAIAAAASGKYDLLWLCDLGDAHSRTMTAFLARLGTVITTTRGSSLDERAKAVDAANPAGIVTFCDALVWDTARLASRLGLPSNSLHTARAITDKFSQRRVLGTAGLQDIGFRLVKSRCALIDAVRDLRRPVIVKPVRSQGSRNTFRVAGPADLKATLASLNGELTRGYVVEEELTGTPGQLGPGIGDYVSVETVTVGDKHHVAGIVGRLTLAAPFRERGAFYPPKLDAATTETVCTLVRRALTALGVSVGVCHTEVKLTPAGADIIEVNGRLGGHVSWLIRRNGGPDLVDAALQASLDRWGTLDAGRQDRISFRHLPPAPMRVGVVQGVTGLREVRGMAGVEAVEVRVRHGMTLDWRQGTGSCLAEVSGMAGSHDEIVRVTDRIERLLRVSLAAC